MSFQPGGMPVTTVLKLDEIKRLIETPRLIREIEAGFVLYSGGHVVVPPVGFRISTSLPGMFISNMAS